MKKDKRKLRSKKKKKMLIKEMTETIIFDRIEWHKNI
jgi:hypothetical protein